VRTEGSQRPTLKLVGGGKEKSGVASDFYGLTSHASTTSHRIQSQVLLEYLNSLECEIENLEYRFSKVCATLNIVMARLVELGLIGANINTTEEGEENESIRNMDTLRD